MPVRTSPVYLLRRLREEPRPLKFLLSRLLWFSGLGDVLGIATTIHPAVKIKFHRSALAAQLWLEPDKLRDDLAFLVRYLRPNDVVVDVGANIGFHTLVAARLVGDRGEVMALEPHPRIHGYLQENVRLNELDNVWTYPVAAGDVPGVTVLSDRRSDDQNMLVSDGQGLRVPVVPLDDLLPATSIALMKIDTEGYEVASLRGAAQALRRTSCVYVECSDRNLRRFGNTAGDLLDLLTSHGFSTFIYRQGELVRVGGLRGLPSMANVVALRGDDAARGISLAEECSR